MKNYLFIALYFLLVNSLYAQKSIESTNEFIIYGLTDSTVTISYEYIKKQPTTDMGNLTITNHAGEFRKEYKNLRGVPLLKLLEKVSIKSPNPRVLSEYYLVCRASDSYTVLFSWNELFNTEVGKHVYIVTETDGASQDKSQEKILLLSTKDFKTGRRHVKGLKSIEVKRL